MPPDAFTADDDLLRRIGAGETMAFALLYDRYSGPAYAFAWTLVGEGGAAEEVVQEVFLALWRGDGIAGGEHEPVRVRLLLAVRRRATDHRRRHHAPRPSPVPPVGATRDDQENGSVDRQAYRALDLLPPEQQRSVVLAQLGGCTHDEIDRVLGAPAGAVKGWLRRGLQTMRTVRWRADEDVSG